MDSKYNLIANNGRIQKFKLKKKPKPIIFNSNTSIKQMTINTPNKGTMATKTNETPIPKQSLQDQRRALPIYGVRNKILEEIRRNTTLIVIGETGSGKTTQIPQYINSARLQNEGKIGITQPRRVAAISIAMRVAQEMGAEIGEIVGYTVRFEDFTTKRTKLVYLTDGMLFREAMVDSLLLKYTVIILDEAHERTVNTDVLFGVVKTAQKMRQEQNKTPLKILIMSATMDVDQFSTYFNNCKTLYIEGRSYPINVFHTIKPQEDYHYSCLNTLFKIHRETPADHDVLIFLTGQEEIEALISEIRNICKDPALATYPAMKVLPLYASLPSEQQLQVFKRMPPNVRKVILSTNVAETSLTITGIKYVIDSGMVKAKTYQAATGFESLKVQKVSQSQAWQRTGRAGRDSKGFCYRMYTKAEFEQFRFNTIPEIQRCNLSSVILQLLALGIDVERFDFMDKPKKDCVEQAFQQLILLGALEKDNKRTLTLLGQRMSQFPLDPRFSKILLSSEAYGCIQEVLSIIAILSSENITVTPSDKRDQAIAARQKFTSPFGDHITVLNIYRAFNRSTQKKHWCFENFCNFRNLNYATEVRQQLVDICKRFELPEYSCGSDVDAVRKCLVTGLFGNVAHAQLSRQMNGARFLTHMTHQPVDIHPSSVLHGVKPECVLYTELLHTSKCYMKFLTTIEPHWLHEIAPDYMRKTK